jgi:voltage-gated potassium channel
MKIDKKRLHEIIFEADTQAGKVFDLMLITTILLSILLVMLDSVEKIHERYSVPMRTTEWVITIIFSIEYLLRIYVVQKPAKYIFSFYGIIDLLAILPGFIAFIFPGSQNLLVIRAIRLLRVFRVLKFTRYTSAGRQLVVAIKRSREKISIFILTILTLAVIFGTIMYLIEGEENGFKSIPLSIYWAIVTLTTVGYGDLSPVTAIGQFIASIVMIMGYAIIAVPTGIVTSEMIKLQTNNNTQICPNCMFDNHDDNALYCKKCGTALDIPPHKESDSAEE